jgi:glucokinase
MNRDYVVGLDMGGTNLRSAAVSPTGRLLLRRTGPSKATDTAEAIVENIAARILELEATAHRRGLGRPLAIGVAVPGPLNVHTGVVYAAPHVKAWRGYPLRDILERRLSRTVVVENDANAWALGELHHGAARGRKNVLLLTLGTGVGGGVVVDGRIVHGTVGMAGELGHVAVELDGKRCDCGASGCLEAYASTSGMQRMLAERLKLQPGAELPPVYLDRGGQFSARAMSAQARHGDPMAVAVFASAGRYLGVAIASFLNIFNPELVVIGGGVATALGLMRRAMMREIKSRALTAALKPVPIVRAALGPNGGVIGAALAAMNGDSPCRNQQNFRH